ncbi:MAG: hypothetical protein FWE06_01945 [Oscillospiraceae bacterium]|nr:hypothetical protein [Oscillospiraceae bacterium]
MDFKDFVLDKLKGAGKVKAKSMVGTHNIVLDGVNLGIICTRMGDSGRWYLKKTVAGDSFLSANNIKLEIGINENSYIVTDFSDAKALCALARITRDELVNAKSAK